MVEISDPMIGRMEALLSAMLITVWSYFINSSPYTGPQVAYCRAIVNLPLLYVHAKIAKEPLFGDWTKLQKCINRGFIGIFSIAFNIQSNKLLSISVYAVLSRLNVFGVLLLNVFFMGKSFSWKTMISGVLTFVGIVLVVSPGTVGLGGQQGLDFQGTRREYLGLLCIVLFILANSVARTFTASIANDVGVVQSVFFLMVFLDFFGAVFAVFDPIDFSWKEVPNILGLGLSTYVFQMLFTDATRREPDPTIITIIQSSVVFFSFSFDYLFLGAKISLANSLGAVLVLLGTAGAVLFKK